MKCDVCGTEVNAAVGICPKCGKVLKSETINNNNNNEEKKSLNPKIIFIIVIAIALLLLLLLSNYLNNKSKEESLANCDDVQTEIISKVNYYGFSFDVEEDVKYTVTDKLYVYTDDFYASIGVLDEDFSSAVANKDSLSGILIKQGYDMSQADVSLRTYGKRQYIVISNILFEGQNYDAIYTNKYGKVIGAMIIDSKGNEVTGKEKETVAAVINTASSVQTASIDNILDLPNLSN